MAIKDDLASIGLNKTSEINLVETTLLLEKFINPRLDILPYQRHVETLIAETLHYIGDDVGDRTMTLEAVRQIIAKRYGYTAQINDDLGPDQNSFSQMIDHRRGNALNLSLLYAHVLQYVGQQVEIVDFETRPLIRALGLRDHVLIDPFVSAKTVGPAQMHSLFKNTSPFALSILNKRDAVLRGQDQTKLFLLRNNAPEAAIAILEASLLISPNEPRLWRELGVLWSRLDQIDSSISALKRFLEISGPSEFRYSASQLLQDLQNRKDKNPS